MKNKLLYTIAMVFITMSIEAQVTGFLKDPRDDKVYRTVKIGTQTWMAENLAYKENCGCWAYGNVQSNAAIYGYLYNWEAAKQVCPAGWHLPGDAEWTQLTTYLGGESVAPNKLKEGGTDHWKGPNTGATNNSGFTALPAGDLDVYGQFWALGEETFWWSSSEDSATYVWYRSLYSNDSLIGRDLDYKNNGFSVRCVRDSQ